MACKYRRYDTLFSCCVRQSAYWRCERCLLRCPSGPVHQVSAIMQCSHIFSRRHIATRWHPDNALCLCATCHAYLEQRPDEHRAFARKVLGDTRFELLEERRNTIVKFTPAELAEMQEHYRSELKRLCALDHRAELVSYQ